jgi:hypothetical protein
MQTQDIGKLSVNAVLTVAFHNASFYHDMSELAKVLASPVIIGHHSPETGEFINITEDVKNSFELGKVKESWQDEFVYDIAFQAQGPR